MQLLNGSKFVFIRAAFCLGDNQWWNCDWLERLNTVCPRSSNPFYIVSNYKNGSILHGHIVCVFDPSDIDIENIEISVDIDHNIIFKAITRSITGITPGSPPLKQILELQVCSRGSVPSDIRYINAMYLY